MISSVGLQWKMYLLLQQLVDNTDAAQLRRENYLLRERLAAIVTRDVEIASRLYALNAKVESAQDDLDGHFRI